MSSFLSNDGGLNVSSVCVSRMYKADRKRMVGGREMKRKTENLFGVQDIVIEISRE